MTVRDIQEIIEQWAPPDIAWERDNVGLQVGSFSDRVQGIIVALDVHEHTVIETRRRRANLIISHHPLLFSPVRSVMTGSRSGRLLQLLLGQGINVYSAHTNLDFTQGGTSFALARRLQLQNVSFLHQPYRPLKKIVTFVPAEHVEAVSTAMTGAGAGTIGKYTHCSFRSEGMGTFLGAEGSKPAIGSSGRLERVPEVRMEMVVPDRHVDSVVRAMRAAHPYEEVAFDVYPMENVSNDYGAGVIGTLKRPMTLKSFLRHVRQSLGTPFLRFTGNPAIRISTVSACGGSGSDLIDAAIHKGADAFVTADVKYHAFQEAEGRIALVDAGHFETEVPVLQDVARRLKSEMQKKGHPVPVHVSRISKNPVRYA